MKYGYTFPSTDPQVITGCGEAVSRLTGVGNTGVNKVRVFSCRTS